VDKNYILCYLYIDDKSRLKDFDSSLVDFKGRKIRNIGQKNLQRQFIKYETISQPMYAITDYQDNDLVSPLGYISLKERERFIVFLKKGLE
jgi:thiol:disulfide interchange protein DsbD